METYTIFSNRLRYLSFLEFHFTWNPDSVRGDIPEHV